MNVSLSESRRLPGATLLGALLLAGCATTQLDAQWSDPQLGGSHYLSGARVMVACDAFELVLRQICQDQLAADISSRGGTPVFPPASVAISTDRSIDAQLLPAARDAGAKAVMVMTLAAAASDVSQGVSIGLGGFGFGRHSGVGVGVGVPIGGGRVTTGYTANTRLTDVQSGRLVWTAKATAPPSGDVNAQIGELSKSVLGAADKTGLF